MISSLEAMPEAPNSPKHALKQAFSTYLEPYDMGTLLVNDKAKHLES